MNKFERIFDRVCTKFQLNPGDWLPHIKPDGIYEMGTSYGNGVDMLDEDGRLREGTPVPIECFSIYGVFWNICYTRRKMRWHNATERRSAYFHPQTRPGRWESLWSFLSDVDMGVYDTTNWVPIEQDEFIPLPFHD